MYNIEHITWKHANANANAINKNIKDMMPCMIYNNIFTYTHELQPRPTNRSQ